MAGGITEETRQRSGRKPNKLTRGDEAKKGFRPRKPSPFPKRRRNVFKRDRLVK